MLFVNTQKLIEKQCHEYNKRSSRKDIWLLCYELFEVYLIKCIKSNAVILETIEKLWFEKKNQNTIQFLLIICSFHFTIIEVYSWIFFRKEQKSEKENRKITRIIKIIEQLIFCNQIFVSLKRKQTRMCDFFFLYTKLSLPIHIYFDINTYFYRELYKQTKKRNTYTPLNSMNIIVILDCCTIHTHVWIWNILNNKIYRRTKRHSFFFFYTIRLKMAYVACWFLFEGSINNVNFVFIIIFSYVLNFFFLN